MKLSDEDIKAIAKAVVSSINIDALAKALVKPLAAEMVAMQRRQESIRHDADFDASMDLEELKRRQHQLLMESRPKKKKKNTPAA